MGSNDDDRVGARHGDLAGALLDVVGALVIVLDRTGRIVRFNKACESTTAYRFEEVKGRYIWDFLIPADEVEGVRGVFDRLTSGQFPSHYVNRWSTRSGAERLIEWSNTALVDGSGAVEFVIGTGIDVTERQRAEAALRQAEERLRRVVTHAPIVLFMTDAAGVFTLSEGHALAALGLEPGQTVGLKLVDVFGDYPEIVEHARRALAGEEFTSIERLAPEGLAYETRWTPLLDAAGAVTAVIGVATDISERLRADEERAHLLEREQRARAHAEAAVRARDEFLSVASHELRTPLTSLLLAVQSVLAVGESGSFAAAPPHMVQNAVAAAERQTRRLAQLVDNLLDVSRITADKLDLRIEDVDLAAVARDVVAGMRGDAEAAGSPLSLLGSSRSMGRWDRVRLEQVLTNLIANSIKYGAGGPIEVIVDGRGDGDTASIEVSDHGIGIAPEMQARIFERFERAVAARHYGGLGLGLHIVHGIVGALGGTVGVESEPGLGATFTVLLPRRGPGGTDRKPR